MYREGDFLCKILTKSGTMKKNQNSVLAKIRLAVTKISDLFF